MHCTQSKCVGFCIFSNIAYAIIHCVQFKCHGFHIFQEFSTHNLSCSQSKCHESQDYTKKSDVRSGINGICMSRIDRKLPEVIRRIPDASFYVSLILKIFEKVRYQLIKKSFLMQQNAKKRLKVTCRSPGCLFSCHGMRKSI